MAVEKDGGKGKVYETTDGTRLEGTLPEVLPSLMRPGGRLSLRKALESNTILGEALRRDAVVRATVRPVEKKPGQ